MEETNEQKLIDIMFEVAQFSAQYWAGKDKTDYYNNRREKHMDWVAHQLRACGFDTEPRGSSWGVLKK